MPSAQGQRSGTEAGLNLSVYMVLVPSRLGGSEERGQEEKDNLLKKSSKYKDHGRLRVLCFLSTIHDVSSIDYIASLNIHIT